MSASFIIYDTEYWTNDGTHTRRWQGLADYPPLLTQIGAVRVALTDGLPVLDEFEQLVIPRTPDGQAVPLNPFFTQLTNITQRQMDEKGLELAAALTAFKDFCKDDMVISYGPDDLATLVPSCYLNGISMPFPPRQFRDARKIFLWAGMSEEDINTNSSGTLAAHFGIELENHHVHDARDDTYSILAALRHLEEQGSLDKNWLTFTGNPLQWGPESLTVHGIWQKKVG